MVHVFTRIPLQLSSFHSWRFLWFFSLVSQAPSVSIPASMQRTAMQETCNPMEELHAFVRQKASALAWEQGNG
jgi:hypothetical protein